jgi:hypothetical protein
MRCPHKKILIPKLRAPKKTGADYQFVLGEKRANTRAQPAKVHQKNSAEKIAPNKNSAHQNNAHFRAFMLGLQASVRDSYCPGGLNRRELCLNKKIQVCRRF